MGKLLAYKNQLRVVGLASVLLIALQQVNVEVPYFISSQGQLLPIREWTLSGAQTGDLKSSFKDNRTGKLTSYAVSAFQRGNEARLSLHPRVYDQARIGQGDTIATIFTNKDEELLVQLQGELQVHQSEMLLNKAGEKAEDVRGFANRLALAREALALQQKITSRTEALYRDSLVSLQEFETAQNLLRSRQLEVQIAQSSLESVTTGSKPAQLDFIQAKNEATRQKIRQIREGLRDFVLLAPLSGVVVKKKDSNVLSDDVLLSVADQSAYVIFFPVPYAEKDYVQTGQAVRVSLTGTTRQCLGKVIGIDNTTQIVDGRQAFFVTALIEEQNLPVVSNTFLRVTVIGQPVTPRHYLARGVRSLLVY
ncbi:MAG: HlyD family efflux transporter periplasmic adaptor subunit [Adhaeribacter sp.]